MDAVYSRVKDLREKVETILLKKIEWRVLFSVDGKRNVADIAEKLDRDATLVEEILQKLLSRHTSPHILFDLLKSSFHG